MKKFTQKQKWLTVGLSILGAGLTAGTICGVVFGLQIKNQNANLFNIKKEITVDIHKDPDDVYVITKEFSIGTWEGDTSMPNPDIDGKDPANFYMSVSSSFPRIQYGNTDGLNKGDDILINSGVKSSELGAINSDIIIPMDVVIGKKYSANFICVFVGDNLNAYRNFKADVVFQLGSGGR